MQADSHQSARNSNIIHRYPHESLDPGITRCHDITFSADFFRYCQYYNTKSPNRRTSWHRQDGPGIPESRNG